jgi:hypothetical protein
MNFAMPARRRICPIDVIVIAFLIGASLLAVVRLGLSPANPSAGVAVIYSPWTTSREALVQAVGAGARFVRFGALPFIAIVIPERPDFMARVARSSAWLVADPQALAGCLAATPPNRVPTND